MLENNVYYWCILLRSISASSILQNLSVWEKKYQINDAMDDVVVVTGTLQVVLASLGIMPAA